MSFIKRRQIIVDKKMQFGTAFSVIAVSFLIVAILIALVGVTATRNNDNLAKVVKVEDEAVQALFAYATRPVPSAVKNDDQTKSSGDTAVVSDNGKEKDGVKTGKGESSVVKGNKTAKEKKPAKKAVAKKTPADDDIVPPEPAVSTEIEIGSIMKDHRDNIDSMKQMVSNNTFLIWSVTALVILQGLVLFFILIIKTHRIAGPIYVMSGYMRQVISGKIPGSLRAIRDKDALKDFYELFCVMIEKLRSGKVSAEKVPTARKTAVKKKAKSSKKIR
jgi:hypothetical protein